MSKIIVKNKFIKSITCVSFVSVIMLWGNPALATMLINPITSINTDANASDSSGISGTNPSNPQINNNGSPNLFNLNNNPSFSFPFVSSQSSQNESNNETSDDGDDSGTETSGNNETGTSTASSSGDTSTNSSTMTTNPQDSDLNTLIPVANMLDPEDPDGSGPTDTKCEDSDDCTTVCDHSNNSDDCNSVKIPEPTSVLAIGMIGLLGLLTKTNQRFL